MGRANLFPCCDQKLPASEHLRQKLHQSCDGNRKRDLYPLSSVSRKGLDDDLFSSDFSGYTFARRRAVMKQTNDIIDSLNDVAAISGKLATNESQFLPEQSITGSSSSTNNNDADHCEHANAAFPNSLKVPRTAAQIESQRFLIGEVLAAPSQAGMHSDRESVRNLLKSSFSYNDEAVSAVRLSSSGEWSLPPKGLTPVSMSENLPADDREIKNKVQVWRNLRKLPGSPDPSTHNTVQQIYKPGYLLFWRECPEVMPADSTNR